MGAVCTETIYGWIYRAGQKAGRLWRYLTRHHARRRKRHGPASVFRAKRAAGMSRVKYRCIPRHPDTLPGGDRHSLRGLTRRAGP